MAEEEKAAGLATVESVSVDNAVENGDQTQKSPAGIESPDAGYIAVSKKLVGLPLSILRPMCI